MRRVVITGLGCVTPCGIGARETWEAVVSGRSGIAPVSFFDVSGFASKVAAEVAGFRAEDYMSRRDTVTFARYLHFGVAAARMAWEDARAPVPAVHPDRVGVCMATTIGAIDRAANDGATLFEKGIQRVHPMFPLQYPGTLASQIAMNLGVHGPTYAIGSACTAGADAVGLSVAQIQSGLLDCVVTGGSDAPIFPLLFGTFDRLGVLSTLNDPPERASRPFSRDRNGFVVGEGAGVLVLEAEEVARARGATIYAEVAGFGATCDAYHHFAPDPEGTQAKRAIDLALQQAGLTADAIDYVNAHGTGTPKNDATETMILKGALGEHARRIPVSSTKSMMGHLIGAAAAVELIVCALALREGVVPPTINFTTADPDCDLDYVVEGAREASLGAVLSTSFGFGSRNAALVLKHVAS